jgi:chaperonin GroES
LFSAWKKANSRSAESSSRTQRKLNEDGKRIPLDVKAGDLVLFGKYTSQEVKLDGEEYLIMLEDEVLAVIDDVGAMKKG